MKKFLSLVLALVMTMSLVTISAGAKDFTDKSSITYGEAVDVVSVVGVVDGYTDGSFNPSATLTRGAAAKIICNLILGPTTASALSADAAPYSDVPTSNVFAGYIAYCAQQGIISGYADGTFRPAATLTSYAFMKMLLGALGYDAEIEGYVGANWSIQVAKQALAIGLDKGLEGDFNGVKAVTREEAALYAFNMLQATMVEYEAKTSVNVGGAEVVIAGSKAKEVANKADSEGIKNDDLMQFAEKYFGKLTKIETTDDFARPATKWTWKGSKVGTYADKADVAYVGNQKLGTIYADLGMTEKDSSAEVYVNGIPGDKVSVAKNNTLKITSDVAGHIQNYPTRPVGTGSIVEVFYDDDNNDVRICVIDTYVAEVNKVAEATSAKEAYITLNAFTGPATTEEFETEGFEEDQIVLYTYANGEIKSVKAAESIQGTLAKITANKKLELGETTYEYNQYHAFDSNIGTESGLNIKSDYTAYMDNNGYIVYVVEEEFISSSYAQILGLEKSATGAFTTNRVKLLTADGKIMVSTTDKNYMAASNGAYSANDIVTYKVNDNNTVTLKRVNMSNVKTNIGATAIDETTNVNQSVLKTADSAYGANDFALTKSNATVTATSGTTFFANSKTVFVVKNSSDDYIVYTGIANAPTITTGGNRVAVTAYCRSANLASIVFIDAKNGTIVNNSKDVIYLAGKSVTNEITDIEDNVYYEYNAVVNGKVTTLTVASNANTIADGVFSAVDGKPTKANLVFAGSSYDSDNVYTDFTNVASPVSLVGTGINGQAAGTVKLSGEYSIGFGPRASYTLYTVADDAKIWTIDGDGNITAAELKDIRTDAANTVVATQENGELTNVFVQLPANSNPDDPTGVVVGSVNSITYSAPTVTINATVAGNYTVSVYVLSAGNYVLAGTYTAQVTTPAVSGYDGTVNIGTLAAGNAKIVCGNQTYLT